MPTVSKYTVIRDPQDNLVLPAEPSSPFSFDLPGLPVDVKRRGDAVLAWVVDTEVDNQQLEVTLNSTKLTLTAKLSSDSYQTIHEVVEKSLLKPADNKLTFKVTGPNGVMRISDVVLWWQFET